MDIKNVLISLRDDLMKWTTNNIKALQATIPSADDFATPEYVNEKIEDIDLKDYVKTVNGVSPNENGNVNITATLEPPTVVDSIEEMVDTNKSYILSTDGFIYTYKKVETVIEEEWINILAEIGYQENKRINSSGEIVTYSGVYVTNYIPCKPGDEVKLEGFSIPSTYVNGVYYQEVVLYREDKTCIKKYNLCTNVVASNTGLSLVEENGYTIGFTLNEDFVGSEVAYMIITSQNITSNSKVLMKGVKATIPNFTNLANTDGTDWMLNKRLATTSISDLEGMSITNAFSSKKGDTIYVKNLNLYQFKSSYHRFGMWLNGARVNTVDGASLFYLHKNGYMNIDDNGVMSFKLVDAINGTDFSSDFDTVRLGVATPTDFSNVIITVNEEITYSVPEQGEVKYEWTNTGISYTSADYSEDIIEIKNDIDNLEKTISNLGNTSTDSSIPSYWTEELETKIDIIQQTMESIGRNKSSFYWYTDAHWQHNAKKSPVLLNHLIKNTPINKVNFGGDIVGDPNPYDHENIKSFYDWQKAITDIPNHHSVYGNHDLNHWTTDVHNMSYSLVLAHEESDDMVVSKIDGCYYIDNPSEKTRYLYLSYLTKSQTDMMTQGQFIVDSIKSAKSGWHIIVIAHRWFQYSKSSTPTIGSVPAYESEILSVLDAYNMRVTRGGSNYFYEQDFTKCKGVVEFCIGGHIHVDYDFTSPGGIPIIITASDTNQERAGGEDEDCGTAGTITEQALYSIIADYENRKVHVIGIGRGGSRELPLLDIEIGDEDDVEDDSISSGVSIGSDEPTDNSVIWIDTDSEEVELATIDDASIRNDSTWSSSKIHNELSNIKINANTQNLSSTPNYVVTEAQNIADKVIKTRNAYSIVISGMSDLHTTGSDSSATGVLHAFQGINEIDKFTPIDLVAIHGDVMVGYMTDEYQSGFKYLRTCMNEITKNVPLIQMQGNHDDLSSDTTEVARQRYFSYIGANNEGTVTDFTNRFRNYGYKDFDDLRIRFIYLNSADASEAERTSNEWITPMQFNWFVNTALNFSNKQGSEDWQWIVACHHPLNTGGVTQYLLNILKAYTTKTSGSFDLYHLDVKHTVSYDFTNVKQKFICHLHGHIHNFRTEWFDDVLSITVPNACYGRNNEYGTHSSYDDGIHEIFGDIDENGQQRQFNKTSGTANDTAFVTFVIDSRVNNKIYAYCYGAGIDREIDLTTKEVKYIEKLIDTPDIPDTPGTLYEYPVNTLEAGKIDSATGAETQSVGYFKTEFIEVTPNSEIEIFSIGAGITEGGLSSAIKLVQYDENKNFISCASDSALYLGFETTKTQSAKATVGNTTKYVKLRIYLGDFGYTYPEHIAYREQFKQNLLLKSYSPINGDISSEPINLLVISDRTYETFSTDTANFREVTVPHELTTDKYYPAMHDGRIGKYCASKITITPNTEVNGFTFQTSSSTGYGLLFPLSISETGKYWIKLACTGIPVVVEVVEYGSDKLYVGRTRLSGGLSGDGVAYQVAFDVTDTSASYAVYFTVGANNINKNCVITNLNVWKA